MKEFIDMYSNYVQDLINLYTYVIVICVRSIKNNKMIIEIPVNVLSVVYFCL